MEIFEALSELIRKRRSTKPALMNGKKIQDELIQQFLQLADWAPTHAHTEPWRFIVYSDEGVKEFCQSHAELYKNSVTQEKFQQATFDKILHNGDKVSHIIVCIMKRGCNPKIPAIEETSAVAAAIEHILLGAGALKISALWSTGGMTHNPLMKAFLQLGEEDVVMGLLYLGYSDEKDKEGVRIIPLEEKVKWVKN